MAASFSVKLLICWTTFLWSCGIQVGYSQYNVYRQDPFAILSRTLLTYQQAACDGQVLNLVCPTSTKISIQLVQYGRTAPSSQVRLKPLKTVTLGSKPLYYVKNRYISLRTVTLG